MGTTVWKQANVDFPSPSSTCVQACCFVWQNCSWMIITVQKLFLQNSFYSTVLIKAWEQWHMVRVVVQNVYFLHSNSKSSLLSALTILWLCIWTDIILLFSHATEQCLTFQHSEATVITSTDTELWSACFLRPMFCGKSDKFHSLTQLKEQIYFRFRQRGNLNICQEFVGPN